MAKWPFIVTIVTIVTINFSVSLAGLIVAVLGAVLHRPTISFVGLCITALAFISSLVFFLHVRRIRKNTTRPNTP